MELRSVFTSQASFPCFWLSRSLPHMLRHNHLLLLGFCVSPPFICLSDSLWLASAGIRREQPQRLGLLPCRLRHRAGLNASHYIARGSACTTTDAALAQLPSAFLTTLIRLSLRCLPDILPPNMLGVIRDRRRLVPPVSTTTLSSCTACWSEVPKDRSYTFWRTNPAGCTTVSAVVWVGADAPPLVIRLRSAIRT